MAVMSTEQISQMYLMPPSVVLTAVFFLMRPMLEDQDCAINRGRRAPLSQSGHQSSGCADAGPNQSRGMLRLGASDSVDAGVEMDVIDACAIEVRLFRLTDRR